MNVLLDKFRDMWEWLSRLTERWVPDSWVICMILTAVALLLAVLGAGVGPLEATEAWGSGLWTLLELAMQFTIAMVAAHACVASRPVFAMLDKFASLPNPDKPLQAVVLACCFSLLTGYRNWALCLVAFALFVPFLGQPNPPPAVPHAVDPAHPGAPGQPSANRGLRVAGRHHARAHRRGDLRPERRRLRRTPRRRTRLRTATGSDQSRDHPERDGTGRRLQPNSQLL